MVYPFQIGSIFELGLEITSAFEIWKRILHIVSNKPSIKCVLLSLPFVDKRKYGTLLLFCVCKSFTMSVKNRNVSSYRLIGDVDDLYFNAGSIYAEYLTIW